MSISNKTGNSVDSNKTDNSVDSNKTDNSVDSNETENSVESNIVKTEENETEKKEEKCGAINFNEKIAELTKDSFDESSEYSYESIPEEKKKIDYFYIIAFSIGLILIYYFYIDNYFLVFAEFILNFMYPYLFIPIKLYVCRKMLVSKLKKIDLNYNNN